MKKPTPPPKTLTEQIRAMKAGEDRIFQNNPAHSVRAIISRLKLDPEIKKRKYVTIMEDDKAHVWRLR